MDRQFHLDDHPEFFLQLIMTTMIRVLKVQGAQSNTGCVRLEKGKARNEEVESSTNGLSGSDRQTEFQKLIKQPTN